VDFPVPRGPKRNRLADPGRLIVLAITLPFLS